MPPRIEDLLCKLRHVENAVPNCIRTHWNYYGLRVHECGTLLSVAKREFKNNNQATGTIEGDPDTTLSRLDPFTVAMQEAGLSFAAKIDPSLLTPSLEVGSRAASKQYAAERCCAGDLCYADIGTRGTMGWIFELDGVLVGLGNHHVFCPAGDQTPIEETRIYKWVGSNPANNPTIGELYSFSPESTKRRVFDCALVKMDKSRVSASFRAPNPSHRKYPEQLGSANQLSSGERFYLIGAESDELVMTFAGVGSRKMDYRDHDSWLYKQLFFYNANHASDSGAVVVHEQSNSVVGLNVGGDSQLTVASPIYRNRWRSRGLVEGFPSFSSPCKMLKLGFGNCS